MNRLNVTLAVVAAALLCMGFTMSMEQPDLKKDEKKYYTGLKVPGNIDVLHRRSWARHEHRLKALPSITADKWDCRTLGLVPPVKDQADCGSCWDFSGTGACESAFFKAGYAKPDGFWGLSEQYTMDCGDNGGCDGDWAETVLEWCKTKGLPTEQEYGAYKAMAGKCRSNAGMKYYKISDYGYVGQQSGVPSVQAMKDALVKFGPLSVAVAADNAFANYRSGTVFEGNSRDINHAVIICGWDDNKGKRGAWLVRNSWSKDWGDNGYIWMGYGANQIGYGALWVSATSLPPVPPDPPGPVPPVPNGAVTITISGTLGPGTYEVSNTGTNERLRAFEAWLKSMPK